MHTKLIQRCSLLLALFFLVVCMYQAAAQSSSAQVSGTVFLDANENGLMEGDEKPIEGAEMTLVAVSGQSERIVSLFTSDSNGAYHFDGLPAGSYLLQVKLPDGHVLTDYTPGGSLALPSSGRQSKTTVFSVADGEQVRLDIGALRRSAYINLIAFGDSNMNGGRMSNEPLLRGVLVDLLYEADGQQYVIAQGQTNKDGELQLRDLTPATYRIAVTMPEPYIIGPPGQKINAFYNIIPPSENNKGLSEPFQVDRSIGLGIGGVKAGALRGQTWLDSNMNGTRDEGEGGLAGITLTLTHLGLGVVRSLTTSEAADFSFEHLQAGEYSIKAELPDDMMFALQNSPSIFQDGYTNSQQVNIQVGDLGATALGVIGVMPASSVQVSVFHDSNVDGVRQEAEPPFSGATVSVLSKDGAVLASTASDTQGYAVLPRVRQGEITIQVSLPDGQVFSVSGGENGNAFASQTAQSELRVSRTLEAGGQVKLFAAATLPASITGILFEDTNLNGVMDGNESGLAGYLVEAIDADGAVAAQTRTDGEGAYTLEQLVPKQYTARFSLVSPFVFSEPHLSGQGVENKVTSQTPEYGQTDWLTLEAGQQLGGVDAGAFRSAVIGGSVLLGNELIGFDGKQGGLEGVRVDLLDENGQTVSDHTNALTDAQGVFSLKGALPGTYSLRITLPKNAKFSKPLNNERAITSSPVTVKASDELTLQPLFAEKTGVISGTAFHDLNNNGLLDADDSALAGVELVFVNSATNERYQALSTEDGSFLLDGLRQGQYQATVQLPEGYGLDANEASLFPPVVEVLSSITLDIPMGERLEGKLIPALRPFNFTGNAFYDNDLDNQMTAGVDTPTALTLRLTHLRSGIETSLEAGTDGVMQSAALLPGAYRLQLSLPEDHLLQHPADATNTEGVWTLELNLDEANPDLQAALVQLGSLTGSFWNMDGSNQDVSGLSVQLKDQDGAVIAETISDEDGGFTFEHLLPLPYLISADLPETYRFAREVDTAQRRSIILSDLAGTDKSTGTSNPITLKMGENLTGQDIGMGAMGKLGDFAWLDLDRDGMQDAGEPGLPGIEIQLIQYGQVSAQTTTDAYGRYQFDSLFPGVYTLQAQMPEEVRPTIIQTDFPLVASILEPSDTTVAQAEGVTVPSSRRNLNADLGFVLKQEGRYPASLDLIPVKDWTRLNEQQPKR